jgi:hypothetical protein
MRTVCFSAGASFGAATVLAGLGAAALGMAPTRAHNLVAAIPLLFAAQQASEGAVWMVVRREPFGVTHSAVILPFLFFALFVWPSYLPVAFRAIEPERARRHALAALGVAGAALGAYLMFAAAFRPSGACIAFGNLYYGVHVDGPFKPESPYVYLALVVAPFAVSSARGTNALALATLASFLAAGALYRVGFSSVWCFFAAMLSGAVVLVVRGLRGARRAERSEVQGR